MRAEKPRHHGRRALFVAVLAIGLAACEAPAPLGREATSSTLDGSAPPAGREIGRVTYSAVDRLLATAPAVGRDTPLAVATLTDTQEIETSAPFGHMVADLIRTRLAQQGMNVSELRLRSAVRMHPQQGELVLGRNTRELVPPPSVAAIVTGGYAVGGRMVFVSMRMVGAGDGRIISAVDFAVPRYPDADALLQPPQARPVTARAAVAR